jgi:hypothetical protein
LGLPDFSAAPSMRLLSAAYFFAGFLLQRLLQHGDLVR